MGNRLLAQRLPSLLPINNQTAHVHTRSQDASFVLQCVRNQGTGQRNSVPPTAPLDNQQNDPVVYLHFGELAQCLPALPLVNNHSHGCVLARIVARALAAVPTRVASRRLPAVDVYLHAYSGELAQRLPALPPLDNPPQLCTFTYTRARLLNPTNAASCRPVLDANRHEHPGELAQLLPALHRVVKRSWTSICTHARASWHSAYWRCILLTTGPGCVPARILGRASSQPTNAASCRQPALDEDLHEYSGDLAQRFAGVDSCRQADLDVYLQACTGELAQRLLALPPVDKRPQLCHASLCSAYRHCLLLTTAPAVYLLAYSASLLTAYRHRPL